MLVARKPNVVGGNSGRYRPVADIKLVVFNNRYEAQSRRHAKHLLNISSKIQSNYSAPEFCLTLTSSSLI